MSTMPGPARARSPRPQPPRQRLNLVPRPHPATSRTPFVLVMALLVGAGAVGLLVLNTALQSRAFALSDLQQQATALQAREAALQMDVDRRSSPERIAARAAALGMVPNTNPVFLRLDDGKVIGDPVAAVAGTNLPGLQAAPADQAPTAGQQPVRAAEQASQEKALQAAQRGTRSAPLHDRSGASSRPAHQPAGGGARGATSARHGGNGHRGGQDGGR